MKPIGKLPPTKDQLSDHDGSGAPTDPNPAEQRRPAGGSPLEVYRDTRNLAGFSPGAGVLVADDLTLTCAAGGELAEVEFAVGSPPGGAAGFTAEFQLFNGCPGQGGHPLDGTGGSVNLQGGDVYVVSMDFVGLGVNAPGTLWLGLSVSTDSAFVVVAGPPELGFSEDMIHLDDPERPQLSCNTWFGGYPLAEHASFYALVRLATCSGGNRHLGYRSEAFSGLFYGGEPGAMTADDLVPLVPACELVGLDVEYAGRSGPFTAQVELRRDSSGSPGSLITGTQASLTGIGNGTLETRRFSFDPPIVLPQRVWLLQTDDSADSGPVIAGGAAVAGVSNDAFLSSAGAGSANWHNLFFGGCAGGTRSGCGTFNATLWCANAPPELPAACCQDDGCDDLTAQACADLGGEWRPGRSCAGGQAACAPLSCGAGSGDCFEVSAGPGCQNSECCGMVCAADDFCCAVQWDSGCADLAELLCPMVPNDDCSGANDVAAGAIPFTTLAATDDGPTLPAACDEGFGAGMGADVWYEFVAPQCGTAVVSTCGAADFDTRLAVYDGCSCPVDNDSLLACNDDAADCAGFTSRASFAVQAGSCYKVRVGGFNGAAGTGTLTLTHNAESCPPTCPAGTVTFIDPPDGVIDARQPHALRDPQQALGIRTMIVSAPPGAENPDCWAVCAEAAELEGIAAVEAMPGGTLRVHLAQPIRPGTSVTLMYGDGQASATFTSHPGNVNGDAQTDSRDVLSIIDYLNGTQQAPWGLYSSDVDHSGLLAPADILAVTDLLNGAGAFDPWDQSLLPAAPSCP
jgi:hypothetical protein